MVGFIPQSKYPERSYIPGAQLVCPTTNIHTQKKGTISYMHTYNYFWHSSKNQTDTHTSNKQRKEWFVWAPIKLGEASTAWGARRGAISQRGTTWENCPVPGSVGIQRTIRRVNTACVNNTVIYPIQIFSGFRKCGKEPEDKPWLDIKISGLTIRPCGNFLETIYISIYICLYLS